jgi:hypothetical protein
MRLVSIFLLPRLRPFRLEEFVKTPASALTQGEFESEELDELQSQDPPAYQRAVNVPGIKLSLRLH